ncbi:MAG TPA: NAD(P)-dependent oxidoreductase, partial [Solirubrobacteraceae bacterium]|nr:NAD(P)-dependent oxidoreductase [Solirubrobacteraceae bacterium]
PPDAQVLVTLLGVPAAIRALLVPSIQWVHVLGAGVEGFPFDSLGARPLTCSRGAAAAGIAEWVLAVMLAWEKSLPESWIQAPPARWNTASLGTMAGRTVGLVGIGAIGSEVARRCLAFDATVVAVRRTTAVSAVPGVEIVSDLHQLLARSDHVVLAAPATALTHRLMDAAAFAALKPGAHLVNVARGSLVDQEALRGALDDGRVARASLDTVDPEPLPAGHWLYTHAAVRLSPHISWSSPHTMPNTLALFVENVRRFRTGGVSALSDLVNPDARY